METMRANNRQPIKCECGLTVMGVNGIHPKHLESTLHKHSQRVQALLAQPCMTLETIGDRLGITKERVRQIANFLNVQPRERQRTCTLKKHWSDGLPNTDSNLKAKLEALRAEGVEVEAKKCLGPNDTYKPSKRRVWVNYKLCGIFFAARSHYTHPRAQVKYWYFEITDRDPSFYLLHCKPVNTTYIVPKHWLASVHKAYIPDGRIEGYNNIEQRDWEQWRENWDQLK